MKLSSNTYGNNSFNKNYQQQSSVSENPPSTSSNTYYKPPITSLNETANKKNVIVV